MMRALRDFFVAEQAVVTGDVVLGPECNIWPGCVLRGATSHA